MYDHVIEVREIEHHAVPGKALGRHVRHDSRSKQYPFPAGRRGTSLKTVVHDRRIAILDQGNVGSCVGNTGVGLIGTDPLYSLLPTPHPDLTETEAVALYSAATKVDGVQGTYPPDDTGTDGLALAKSLVSLKLTPGYLWALSFAAMQNALQSTPVGVGVNWYDSFDDPDSSGRVKLTAGAQVRGGHEFEVRGIDVDAKTFLCDNSWSAGWGLHGSFVVSWADMERLLSEQGDVVVILPMTAPVPTPTPTPPPAPTPAKDPNDILLASSLRKNFLGRFFYKHPAQDDVRVWLERKDL